jgi:hypothetical protein
MLEDIYFIQAKMKNNTLTNLLLFFLLSNCLSNIILASESRWDNFDKRVAKLSKSAGNIKVSGTDYFNLLNKMEIARTRLDDIDSGTIGDCMNWIGFYYAVHTKRNNPNLSDKDILDIAQTNIFYIFNNQSFSYIANYTLKIKNQNEDIWRMNMK